MKVQFRRIRVTKRYPLAISRGIQGFSDNLFVTVEADGQTGLGELALATASDWTAERGQAQLEAFLHALPEGLSIHQTWQRMREQELDPPAMAAFDVALWDLFAKRCGQPLYRVFGLGLPQVPTSVTIGLNPLNILRERVPEMLARTRARCLKIKLGSPEGLEADRESFEAIREVAAPFGVRLRVDANGGWDLAGAKRMMAWLAERGVDYVEQPLSEGEEGALGELFEGRPLPIYADESCRFAADVPKLAGRVDGVNLKLMKCGGLTEALRIVAAARACGLGTMIGCMSESSVAISAGAAIGALMDHIDLDSNLNLMPDVAQGAMLVDGVVLPPEAPGHGAQVAHA